MLLHTFRHANFHLKVTLKSKWFLCHQFNATIYSISKIKIIQTWTNKLKTHVQNSFEFFQVLQNQQNDVEGAAAYVWLFGKLKFKFFHCQTEPNAKRGFGLNAPRHLSA